MSLLNTKDVYITCPYEKSHQIILSRLQFHLVKCEKAHQDTRLVLCPFNSTHKVREPELKCHITYFCPDRGKVDTYICRSEENAGPLIPLQPIEIDARQLSESWDNEEAPTYNPEKTCQDKPLLLTKQGATPSQRKEFRMAERHRLQNLRGVKEQKQCVVPCSASQPLRLPSSNARSAGFVDEEPPPTPVARMNNGNAFASDRQADDGFVIPRYARGRGRGRIPK